MYIYIALYIYIYCIIIPLIRIVLLKKSIGLSDSLWDFSAKPSLSDKARSAAAASAGRWPYIDTLTLGPQ